MFLLKQILAPWCEFYDQVGPPPENMAMVHVLFWFFWYPWSQRKDLRLSSKLKPRNPILGTQTFRHGEVRTSPQGSVTQVRTPGQVLKNQLNKIKQIKK